jgi:hypothetical protein
MAISRIVIVVSAVMLFGTSDEVLALWGSAKRTPGPIKDHLRTQVGGELRATQMLTALSRVPIRGSRVVAPPGTDRFPAVRGLAAALARVRPGQNEVSLLRKGDMEVLLHRSRLGGQWRLRARQRIMVTEVTRMPAPVIATNLLLGLNTDCTPVVTNKHRWQDLRLFDSTLNRVIGATEIERALKQFSPTSAATSSRTAPGAAPPRGNAGAGTTAFLPQRR